MATRALADLKARLQFDTTDGNRVKSEMRSLGPSIAGALKPAEDSAGRLTAHFKNLSVNIAAGLGIYSGFSAVMQGVGGAISSTISSGVKFQDTMNTLQAVTGASAAQMRALSDRSIALGNDLSLPNTSAADAAGAMTELAKAGLSVSDSMAAAKGTLQLAAAAGVGEAEAALLAASALNAFRLPGSEANRIADLLAASANASAASIGEMGYAMQASASVFAAAHIPVEDLTTAIAEMANAGIRGQDAGTSLKSALLALQTPSKQQSALMQELNVHLYDQQGRMVSLRDLIGQFEHATVGLTQKQRDYALGIIFGSDAVRAANILIGEGTAGFDKMKEAVTKTGAAQDVAGAKAKGLGGAVRGLQSEWETLQLTLFLKVAPALEAVVRFAAEKLPGVQGMVIGLADQLGKWADAISAPFQNALDVIGKIQTALSNVGHIIAVTPAAATAGAAPVSGLTPGIGENAPPTQLPLPVEGLTPGIGAGALKSIDWGPTGDELGRNFADAIVKQSQKIADAVLQALQQGLADVNWFSVGQSVGTNAGSFALGFVDQLFQGLFKAVKEHPMEALFAGITLFITPARLAQPIIKLIPGARFLGIPQFNQLGNDLMGAFFRGLTERLALSEGGWAVGLSRLLVAASELPGKLRELGLRGAEALGSGLGGILRYPVSLIQVFVRNVDLEISVLIRRLPQIAGEAMGGFRDVMATWAEEIIGAGLPQWVGRMIGVLGRLVEPFGTLAGRAMGGVRDVVVTVGEGIRGYFASLWDAIWSFLVARWSSILASAGERFGAVRAAIAERGAQIWANVTALWDQIWSWLASRFNAIWSLATERWAAIRDTIVNWATNARDRVGQLWEDMVGAAGGAGGRIWSGIKSGLNGAIGVLNTFSHGINRVLGTFGVPHIPDIPGLAAGGVLRAGSGGGRVEGITAVVGEGAGPEYVIPTENRFRSRAIELLRQAADDLGLIGLAGGGILNWLPSAGAMVQGPGGSFSHQHLNAWDFMASNFSRLYAGLPGSVSQYTSASSGSGYGNSILFQLDQGGQLILAHLAQVLAHGHVDPGALIGLTDNTGFSTGPHLHFEVLGSALNPMTGGYSGGIPGLRGLVAPIDIGALIRAALSPLTGAAHAAANAISEGWARGVANSIIDKVAANISGRGGGGPVVPGRVYSVGERGPELFSPDQPGQILAGQGGTSIGVLERIARTGEEAARLLARIEGSPAANRRSAQLRYGT